MQKSPRLLSLSSWPTHPLQSQSLHLSPITKRILSQVHLSPSDLLPLPPPIHLKPPKTPEAKQSNQDHLDEMQRRRKQVSILLDIRTSYILGKEYGVSGTCSARKQSRVDKERSQSRSGSQLYEREVRMLSIRSRSKLARNLSRVSSKKQGDMERKMSRKLTKTRAERSPSLLKETSEYLVHFDPRCSKNTRKQSNLKEDDSTKIHPQRKPQQRRRQQSQYGFLVSQSTRRDSSIKATIDESRQICSQLLKTVKDWQHLDSRHTKQLTQIAHLTSRQRQRLCKMQSLEKKAMGVRMKSIKSRLRSEPTDGR